MPVIDVKSHRMPLTRSSNVSAQGNQLHYLIRSLEHEGYNQIVNEVDLGRLLRVNHCRRAWPRPPALFKPNMTNIALRDPI